MELIDDEGKLFGVVNVIDALVVLLVLAVLIAGVALLDPFGSTEPAERYATIDLGEQQPFVAEQISTGDVMSPPGTRNATVTDVHVGPAEGSNVSVTARVRINGSLGEDGESFTYGGNGIRQGGEFTLETDEYTASGTVTRLGTNGTALDTVTRQVRLDGRLSATSAQRLQSGDTVTYASREGATVETIYIGPGDDPTNRRVTATVSVEALRQSGDLTFGDQSVQLGQSLSFDFGEYGLSGAVEAIGEDAAIETESAEVSVVTTVSGQVAQGLQTGDTYDLGPATVATIDSVNRYPGPSDGQRRIYADLSLETVIQDGERYFGPDQLSIGASITFRTPEYTFSGTIESLGEPVERNTTQVRLEGTVSATTADRIERGEAVTLSGTDIATINDVYLGPGNDDTTRRFVALATLETRRQPSGLTFGSQSIELGQSLTLDFDDYQVSGVIDAIGDGVTIETDTTTASLVTTVSGDVATRLQANDTYEIGPVTAATIDSVTQYPGKSDNQRRLYVDLSLETVVQDGDRYFGSDQLSIGTSVPFRTPEYAFSGTVEALGEPAEQNTTQVRLEGTVSATTADRIESGETVTIAGTDIATIDDVYLGPGNDATTRRFIALATLETRRQPGGLTFGSQSVELGQSLTLTFDDYRVAGEIAAIGDGATIETETAEVSLVTTVSGDVATRLQAGDTYDIGPVTAATIDSVTQYPGPSDGQRRLYVDLSVETVIQDGERYFGPDQLSIGASIPFRTPEYSFSGTIETLGTPAPRNTTKVAIETTVSNTVADAIEIGDTFQFGGQSIASVRTMDVYPTGNDGTRRVLLGLDLQTVMRDSGAYFGTDRVTLGSTIPFETDVYRLSGEVIGRDAYVPNGSVTTETISVKVANVQPEIADGIEVGMVEESMEQTTAEIVDKQTEPASIILTSESGEIFERTHPRNEDVYLTVDAAVRETPGGYQFHAQSLTEGETITLDFRTITVRGTVTDI